MKLECGRIFGDMVEKEKNLFILTTLSQITNHKGGCKVGMGMEDVK